MVPVVHVAQAMSLWQLAGELARLAAAARDGTAKSEELSGSTLTVALPGEAPRRGAYQVVSNDDGQLELAIAGHDGHVDRTQLTLETERLLRWHLTSVHTLVMRRE